MRLRPIHIMERGDAMIPMPDMRPCGGKVSVQYERVFGDTSAGQINLDPALRNLTTGKLELEILPAQPNLPAPPKN